MIFRHVCGEGLISACSYVSSPNRVFHALKPQIRFPGSIFGIKVSGSKLHTAYENTDRVAASEYPATHVQTIAQVRPFLHRGPIVVGCPEIMNSQKIMHATSTSKRKHFGIDLLTHWAFGNFCHRGSNSFQNRHVPASPHKSIRWAPMLNKYKNNKW